MRSQKIQFLFLVFVLLSISKTYAQVDKTSVRFSASGYTLTLNYDKANIMSSGKPPRTLTLNDEELQKLRNLFNEEFFALNEQRSLQSGQRVVISVQIGSRSKNVVFYHSEEVKETQKLAEIYTFFDALAKNF